jgi:hypothetical protein
MKDTHVAIIDHIGRNIIGKLVEETGTTLSISNPVILHCQPQANGQLEVQTFPVFFFEFIDKTKRENNTWTYTKSNIVTSNITLDERIITQYAKINTAPEVVEQPTQSSTAKVISINDL